MDNVVTAGASLAMALPRGTGSDEVHRPDGLKVPLPCK
jgi:hypothetical protein